MYLHSKSSCLSDCIYAPSFKELSSVLPCKSVGSLCSSMSISISPASFSSVDCESLFFFSSSPWNNESSLATTAHSAAVPSPESYGSVDISIFLSFFGSDATPFDDPKQLSFPSELFFDEIVTLSSISF